MVSLCHCNCYHSQLETFRTGLKFFKSLMDDSCFIMPCYLCLLMCMKWALKQRLRFTEIGSKNIIIIIIVNWWSRPVYVKFYNFLQDSVSLVSFCSLLACLRAGEVWKRGTDFYRLLLKYLCEAGTKSQLWSGEKIQNHIRAAIQSYVSNCSQEDNKEGKFVCCSLGA